MRKMDGRASLSISHMTGHATPLFLAVVFSQRFSRQGSTRGAVLQQQHCRGSPLGSREQIALRDSIYLSCINCIALRQRQTLLVAIPTLRDHAPVLLRPGRSSSPLLRWSQRRGRQ